jgi:hypothetical protein
MGQPSQLPSVEGEFPVPPSRCVQPGTKGTPGRVTSPLSSGRRVACGPMSPGRGKALQADVLAVMIPLVAVALSVVLPALFRPNKM